MAINNARTEITQLHNTIREHEKTEQGLKIQLEGVEKRLGESQRRSEGLALASERNK